MATKTYTTSKPSNWIKYPSNSTASSGGSHFVGWESSRYRIEKYSFTTGSYPITEVSINFGSVSHYGGNANFNIYYYITTNSSYQNSIDGENSTKTGKVTLSGGKGAAKATIKLAKNTTYYIYVWSEKLSGEGPEYWGAKNWSSSAATITATETQTTKCSAPTKVTVSKTIVSPTGSFSIKWSGAKGGTNNHIVSYDVYLKVTSAGTAPTVNSYTKKIWVDATGDTTSGSTTINLPNLGLSLTRGYKIVCGVVTRGWAEDNYFSGIAISSPIIINSLPSAPSVTVNKTFLLSNENSVTFSNITAGTDVNDSQTKTVWYSTSQNSNKTKITGSSLTKTINTSITYYFYTYDGLEYGPAKTIKITKNIKPLINSVSGVVPTYTFAGNEGKTGLQLGYAYTILPTISVNKTGTLTIFIDMDASNNTDSASYSYTETITQELTSTSKFTPNNNYNIYTRAIAYFGSTTMSNTNIKWRLRFQLSDNNEHSDIVYYPNDNKFYTIAHSAELKGVYNQFADSNIPNVIEGQVRKKVRFKFDNDTSVPNISISAKVGNDEVKLPSPTITTSNDSKFKYIDLTLPDNITGGSRINITVLFADKSNQPTKVSEHSKSVTETLIPTLTSFIHGAETIYPFTSKDTDNFEIKVNWPFGSSNALNDDTLRKFNCSIQKTDGIHYDAIKFIHRSDETNKSVLKQLDWEKDSDWLVANPSPANMYGWNKELGYDTYSGKKTYYCQFQITNLFRETFTLNLKEPRYFNFNETARELSISSIQWAESNTDSTKWKNFNTVSETSDGNAAQEGMYLKFNLSFDLFTEEAITVQLKRKINNEESILIPKTYLKGELEYATGRTAKNNKVSLVYGPIGEISDDTNRVWSFQITNTRGTAKSKGVEMKVQRQTAPDIKFTSCTVNYNSDEQKYKIKYSFKQIDNGGGSIANYLCNYDDKDKTNLTAQLSKPSSGQIWSNTVDSNATNWEVKSVCVKSVSTVTGLISLTKEYYSNYIIVYEVSPTVAYRKNQLGINTDSPNTECIIDIRPTINYKKIRLYDGRSDVIELDLSKIYNNDNNTSYPAITVKKGTTEYTLFFD